MTEQRSRRHSRRAVLAAGGVALAAGLAGCVSTLTGGSADSLMIFHAGSLDPPISDAASTFSDQENVEVQHEAKGSVGSTKKITEEGRKADVLGVSDFRLIRDMMLPNYGDWYGIFTTNAMAIAYTKDSKYADEFSKGNWWKVLARDDVTFAHSDPAVDPNGYRSVMAMQLGAIPLDGKTLFSNDTSKKLIDKAKIPSGTETSLVQQLKSGEIDYAWEYKSAGASHDVEIVELQPQVNLAKATDEYATHYAKAKVKAGGNSYTGAPIAYGITVPSVAEHATLGAKFVSLLSGSDGRSILSDDGFSPVKPMVVPKKHEKKVPDKVMSHSTAKSSLGPMTL